eukprot:gene20244-biopygen8537
MFCSGGDRAIFAQAEIVGKSAPTPVALWGSPSDGVEWSGVHRGFPYVIDRREPHARSPQKDASQKAFTLAIDRAPRTGTLLRSTRDWESTGKGSTGLEGGRCWVNKIRSLWRRKSAGNTLESKVTVAVSEPYRSFPLHHQKAALSAGPR